MEKMAEASQVAHGPSDNAGGGERGLRATVTQRLLESVASDYGIDVSDKRVDLGGSSNLNVRVGEGESYVVRVYRPHVTTDRLNEIHRVRHHLAAVGVPCDGLLRTLDGRPWIEVDDRLVEVEKYVEHDAHMNTWERLAAGLRTLGAMHDALANLEIGEAGRSPRFANYISADNAFEATLRGVRRLRQAYPSEADLQVAANAEQLARFLSDAERLHKDDLPAGLAHGDFWDNNVFFRDSELVFVTDFDYMGYRPRIDDLALTLYFTCLEFFENPVSDTQLERLAGLLRAYDDGTVRRLSTAERAALPLAMARQPLWSIGGWVVWLDDEQAVSRHAASAAGEVQWALSLIRDLERWQAAFA
jgi:Ser/Thr protein kinase RdoA (MazF antagonist)